VPLGSGDRLQVLAVHAARMAATVDAINSAARAKVQPTPREPVKSKQLAATDGRQYGVHARRGRGADSGK